MFYFFLTIKLILFLFVPIITSIFIVKGSENIKKIATYLYVAWIVFVALLTYVPFYFYWQRNESNIQALVHWYWILILVFLYLAAPIIYLFFVRKPNFIGIKKIIINLIGIIWLVSSISIVGFIPWFNYQNSVILDNICYKNHASTSEKLNCCLDAEYVWNEGFAFENQIPENCEQFMNWND